MAAGPKRAPRLLDVAQSKGTPQTTTSAMPISLLNRRRMNEGAPAKVGSWEPPFSGPIRALSMGVWFMGLRPRPAEALMSKIENSCCGALMFPRSMNFGALPLARAATVNDEGLAMNFDRASAIFREAGSPPSIMGMNWVAIALHSRLRSAGCFFCWRAMKATALSKSPPSV